jgi:hypothetical protein
VFGANIRNQVEEIIFNLGILFEYAVVVGGGGVGNLVGKKELIWGK